MWIYDPQVWDLNSNFFPVQRRCSECGRSLEEFIETGLMGCSYCYDSFAEELETSLLQNYQRARRYKGRKPGKPSNEQPKAASEISESRPRYQDCLGQQTQEERAIQNEEDREFLQRQLKKAIEEEAYEEAARLRDLIHAKEKGGESK